MSTAILQSPTSSPVPSTIQSVGGSGGRVETLRLYTDSNATFYFRRLAWSPDGSLLLTPAGIFEPPNESTSTQDQPIRNSIPSTSSTKRKANENEIPSANASGPRPTVYLYSRANITRPPIAHLPGHRTTSIAVRFCPVLWRLRDFDESGVRHGEGLQSQHEVNEPCVVIDLRRGETVCADLGRPSAASTSKAEDWDGDGDGDEDNDDCEVIEPQLSGGSEGLRGPKQASISDALPSPVVLFDLPYRMIYAVATMDCVYLYDTQQASPIAMFANLHYAPFTDLAWSPDGQTLVLSAEDGYCTVVAFDEHELGIPHDVDGAHELPALPATMAAFDGPIAVQPPSGFATVTTPAPAALPALFASMTGGTALLEVPGDKRAATNEAGHTPTNEPPKKKKKAVLVHHGPLGSSMTG
ncbi:BZ3500_MvSof-1268-A1-R1_Chr10-2g02880 [Microbotryum saponariae]|uniref:BZ3500_MvSof-1268-A1-R1_Chr10-2g02880 protein n=1 Tax=Microbotryum saponariae TaxID=289078 RepID=A0A2X0L4Z1_9BASI|nr:BZ3501_MvSof-1269-A2-R1_Chr10-2g02466 [Microbotryum saponariae]SDA01664.1 BZ3500_MvSof-1268-A1-R1_Chr10-2g02880 [Microbotryum saponariae]